MEGVGVSCIHPGQPGCCLLALCTDADCRDADSQFRDIRCHAMIEMNSRKFSQYWVTALIRAHKKCENFVDRSSCNTIYYL